MAGCFGFFTYPIRRCAGAIGAVTVFRHQTFKPEFAGFPKQLWSDLALLKVRYEDAIRTAGQQPGKVVLAHGERQLTQIVTVEHQGIESVKLHFIVVLA
jgi:hypothetical protein